MKKIACSFLTTALVCLVIVSCLGCSLSLPSLSDLFPAPTPSDQSPGPTPYSPVVAPEPQRTPEPAPESTSTTDISAPLEAEQPQKPHEIMNWLRADLSSARDNLIGMNMSKVYLEKTEDGWEHILYTGTNILDDSFTLQAGYFVAALGHLENALSLVEKKKLPTEVSPRNVTEKEILVEAEVALDLLKRQIDYAVQSEKEAINWVEAYKNPTSEHSTSYIDKNMRIKTITELYYKYREKLLLSVDTLENVMSYGQPYLQGQELTPAPTIATKPEASPAVKYSLNVIVYPERSGNVSPSTGTYDSGESVTLMAKPAEGYEFDYWGGDAQGSSTSTTITVDFHMNVIAYFKKAVISVIYQTIEYEMPPGASSAYAISYHNQLEAGQVIDGFVIIIGEYGHSDQFATWLFQIFGPANEKMHEWEGNLVSKHHHDFSLTATNAGRYTIKVSQRSRYAKNLHIYVTPPGWAPLGT